MGAQTRRDLFINVGGSSTDLQAAAKAGRSALIELGGASGPIMDMMAENFKKLGPVSEDATATVLKNYDTMLSKIRSLQAGSAGDPGAALKFFDTNSLNEQIAAAEKSVAINREIAQTAQTVAQQGGPYAATQMQIAAAFNAQVLAGEKNLVVLRDQAGAIGQVSAAMKTDADGAEQVAHGANKVSLAKMEMMHVVRSSGDALAAGAAPAQIFAMEIGRIAEAAQFAGGEGDGALARFGRFMGSGWGLAITVGIAVLSPFIAKLFETESALDKATKKLKEQGEQAETTAQAQAIYDRSLDGIISKETKLAETLERQLKTREQLNREAVAGAAASVATSETGLTAARRELSAALDAQKKFNANPPRYSMDDGGASQIAGQAFVDNAVAVAQKKLKEATEALAQSRRDQLAAEASDARYRAATLGGPHGKEKLALDAREERNTEAFLGVWSKDAKGKDVRTKAPTINLDQYTREQQAIENARKALEHTSSASAAADASLGNMVALIKQLFPGVRITSTDTGVHVKGSDHYKDRAIDFVPRGGMGEFTTDEVEARLKAAGVKIRRGRNGNEQFFGPGRGPAGPNDHSHDNHFHVAWEGSPSPESADRSAEEAKRKADESATAFAAENNKLDTQLAAAKRRHLETVAEQYQADLVAVDQAKVDADTEIDKQALLHKWTPQQVALLKAKEAEVRDAQKDAVDRARKEELDRKALDVAKFLDTIDGQILQLQLDNAKTLKERRDLQHKQLERERDAANRAIDEDKNLSTEQRAAEHKKTNTYYDMRGKQVDEHGDPMQDYLDRLKSNVGDMNTALKGVEADGLQSLEDGLIGIVTGTETVAEAFKKMALSIIADLAKIAIEKAFVAILDKTMNGGSSFSTGHVPSFARGIVPRFASGLIRGPGTGTSDSIPGWLAGVGLIRVSNGESIMTAEATRQYGPTLKAMNDNALPRFATGVVPANVGYPRVDPGSASPVAIHMPPIYINAPGADATALASLQREVAELRRAMPEIALKSVADAQSRFVMRGM